MSRDHGGGLDAAVAEYGGQRGGWIDLSTGINPVPYPVSPIAQGDWMALPDRDAQEALIAAARRFWDVPDGAAVLAAPGASSLIARLPALAPPGRVTIPAPTYNEHAAAFAAQGWAVQQAGPAEARVLVHPNNPDGRVWPLRAGQDPAALTIIDESFCDIMPGASHIQVANRPGVVILKSFGKFWGLAGLRLGFAIGRPELIDKLATLIGPWPVAGPALRIGAQALDDTAWARETRARLAADAARLDGLMARHGLGVAGGTDLFRLYGTEDAAAWQRHLARQQVWSRVFPYSARWLRLGLPAPAQWDRVSAALERAP